MAAYDTGYEDERFQHPVGHTLHCGVCMNVLKDPVMCQGNEHLCCRACIIPYLRISQTCPTCMEPLTVETLRPASRGIRRLLAELKIRCEFYDRGCGEFIELENLERHVRDCGFAPAVCSNEGCRLEVNQRDLLHHETVVCEHRRVQCHSCSDIKREIEAIKVSLATMDEKLDGNKKELVERIEEKTTAAEKNVIAKVELVLEQFDIKAMKVNLTTMDEKSERNVKHIGKKLEDVVAKVGIVQEQEEESNRRLETEVKKCFNEINRLGNIVQTLPEVQAEQMRKGIAEAGGMEREPKVLVAGGENKSGRLNSVEILNLSKGTWAPLQPLRECRSALSSIVHDNKLFVIGGYAGVAIKSIEVLSLNAVHVDQGIPWEKFAGHLPSPLFAHGSVVYNGRLTMIGGHGFGKDEITDNITEVSLVSPYTSKLLINMPQKRWYHGVAILGDKVLIVGSGRSSGFSTNRKSVLLYNITKNECQELAPLPYNVHSAATVKWGDDNVLIMGGADSNGKPLNKVLLYNVKTQKSHELPDMKFKRMGCVAAVVKDTVIVMGGKDEDGNCLKSVECFRFDTYSWQNLPDMHHGRYLATAVAC